MFSISLLLKTGTLRNLTYTQKLNPTIILLTVGLGYKSVVFLFFSLRFCVSFEQFLLNIARHKFIS